MNPEDNNSFKLDSKKRRLLQEMAGNVKSHYGECCPFLGECKDEEHACNFPDYADCCYIRKK